VRDSWVVGRWIIIVLAMLAGCRIGYDQLALEDVIDDGDGGARDGGSISTSRDGGIDAAPGLCADPPCAGAGGVCIDNVCVIQETNETAHTCPAGMPCRIECTGAGRPCRDGVSCGDATICELQCIGFRACQDGASCGTAGECTVTCEGEEACESGITSSAGTTCVAHCCGLDACASGVGNCTSDAVCN
jgi:hypothetical protein